MNLELRLPTLTEGNAQEQVRQLHSYLKKTVRQLNMALSQLERTASQSAPQPPAAQQTFQNIKGLIIKSADIVSAYYEKIDDLLKTSGQYVAQSDFGTYKETTDQRLGADHDSLTQLLRRTEQVEGALGDYQKTQSAYLRYGAVGTTLDETALAADTAPGIEIGDFQRMEDGAAVAVHQRFARFTAYGLELFGASMDTPIAYLSGDRLYITNAEILQGMKLGGYLLQTQNGIAFSWIGGGN